MEFKKFLETFGGEAEYWAKKSNVSKNLHSAIEPYLDKKLKMLDLGSGGGRLAVQYLPRFSVVHAIDLDKELVDRAAKDHPGAIFSCGDYLSRNVWEKLGTTVDIIVSNCAIRKDYCSNLPLLAKHCHDFLNPNGVIVFKIQAHEDLKDLLPEELRSQLFYNYNEIQQSFSQFELTIENESYQQTFSSADYIRKFLSRIQIPFSGPIRKLKYNRMYYIVHGKKT